MRCESGGTRQQIYRTTSHTKYDLKYHLVWITKYRRAVLGGAVGTRVRELVREICRANDIEIVKGHVGKDHVHLFVSVPPYLSVSKVMQYLKGKDKSQAADGVRASASAILGEAFVGQGVLCSEQR